MIDSEVERSKVLSWVAVLMDQACDQNARNIVQLQAKIVDTRNNPKKALHKVEKLLIVSEPKKTTMYMTLKSPDACCNVKHILASLLSEPFGAEVLKHADRSLHPMNLKDKSRIEKWQLACEFQTDLFEAPEAKEDDSKRPRRKGPARLKHVGDWANEAEIVPAASSAIVVQSYVKQAADTVEILTKQLDDLRLKEERIKHAKNDPKKRSDMQERIDQLEDAMNRTKDQNKQLDLGYEISKMYNQLEALDQTDVLNEIGDEKDLVQKQLGKVKLEKDLMDEYYAEAVLQVVDYAPAVPLYVVSKMKEEDRRDLIIDKLPLDMPLQAQAYQQATGEGNVMKAKKQFEAISKTILTTSLELVQEGSLPDYTKNSPNRIEFLNRTAEVTKAVTGTTPDRDDLKKALNKERQKKCAYCSKPYETCYWNLDKNQAAPKPDDTAHIVGLCGTVCEKYFRQMPMCHNCHQDDRAYFQIKPGEGLIDDQAFRQSVPLVTEFLKLQRQVMSGRKELQNELEEARVCASAAVADLDKSFLPNFWCVKCDVQCLPRDLMIIKPDYDKLVILFSETGKQITT